MIITGAELGRVDVGEGHELGDMAGVGDLEVSREEKGVSWLLPDAKLAVCISDLQGPLETTDVQP